MNLAHDLVSRFALSFAILAPLMTGQTRRIAGELVDRVAGPLAARPFR